MIDYWTSAQFGRDAVEHELREFVKYDEYLRARLADLKSRKAEFDTLILEQAELHNRLHSLMLREQGALQRDIDDAITLEQQRLLEFDQLEKRLLDAMERAELEGDVLDAGWRLSDVL